VPRSEHADAGALSSSPGGAHAPARSRPAGTILLTVFVLALAVRITFMVFHPEPLRSDELDYDQLGWTLAKTGHFATDGHPTAYHMPGYPAVVAAMYAIFGRSPAAVKIAQAILDSFTALLLAWMVARTSLRAALGVGIVWAFFPAAVLFSSQLFSETVFVFGLVAVTALVARARSLSSPAACALGIALGGLILIRPVAGILIPTLAILLPPARVRVLLIVFACVPVVLWIHRNAVVIHRPVLSTLSGANLLIANYPGATGRYSVNAPAVTARDEAAMDSASTYAAIRYIRDDPTGFAVRGARKALLLLTSEGELAMGHFSPRAAEPARYLERLRAVPTWIYLLVGLPTAITLILGCLGLAIRRIDAIEVIFIGLTVATVLSVIPFIGSSRYRFPLMPYFALFSIEFLAPGRSRFAGVPWPRIALACAASLLIVLVWGAELHMVYG